MILSAGGDYGSGLLGWVREHEREPKRVTEGMINPRGGKTTLFVLMPLAAVDYQLRACEWQRHTLQDTILRKE